MACSLPFNLSNALTSNPLSRWQAWRSKKEGRELGERSNRREKRKGRREGGDMENGRGEGEMRSGGVRRGEGRKEGER